MDAVGELSLQRNSCEKLRAMFKDLFNAEYYSSTLGLQKRAGLHIRLETTHARTVGSSKYVDLETRILEDVSNANGPLSTLVVGDSGTGKSWLALNLTKQLFDSTRPEFQNKIPLYIPLGRVENMISQQRAQASSRFRSDILFSYIMNHTNHFPTKIHDRELQNLYLDLCACELILILDGYDELKVKFNLWEENRWRSKHFKNVRTIVSSRPIALIGLDVSKIFGFSDQRQCSYVILPLEGNLVEKYISQVPLFLQSIEYDSNVNDPWMMTKSITKDYPQWESVQKDSEYKYWFLDRLPELQGLAQNVFLLTIICQLLPKLVETERIGSNGKDVTAEFMLKLQEICRTEVLLYDRFTETWFKYQVERMEATGHAHCLYENRYILHHYMGGYAQNLAMHCALTRGMLSNGEIQEDKTLFWNLWTPWSPNSEEFHRDKSLEELLFPQNENDTNEDRVGNLKFLRDSCLMRYESGVKIFRFFHLSLFEYFLSREVFERYRGTLNYYSNYDRRREGVYFLINQSNINDPEFSGVLSMLVGRAETDENFQATLLEAIKKSATLPGIERMASNAFTILNLSGYSFSGRNTEDDNFQNIQVPGANFSNSICGNSDFSGSNFENAKLNQGWFQGCNFQGINFKNTSFGQIPPIYIGVETSLVHDMLCCTIDGFQHVVLCCQEYCATEDKMQLYLKNYKLNADFKFVEFTSIFILDFNEKEQYLFSLIQTETSVFLFLFVECVLGFLSEEFMGPAYWFEFSFNSLVNSGKFGESDLNFSHHLEVFNERHSTQKFILFFRNKNPEFCDKEALKSVYGKNREIGFREDGVPSGVCRIKFIWVPFGSFKFLVSIWFREIEEIGGICLMENIQYISFLHDWKPILCNKESVALEIFWQVHHADDEGMQEAFLFNQISIHCRGSYFDDNVVLSFPSTANIYFFDIKTNQVLTVLKTDCFVRSISNHESATSEHIAFAHLMDHFRKRIDKMLTIIMRRSTSCFLSENLDFIARKSPVSTDVFSVKTGTLSKNVLQDLQTPVTFKHSIESTYVVYILRGSLHFEKLEMIHIFPKNETRAKVPVEKYFSEDGLCVEFPCLALAAFSDIYKFLPGADHFNKQGVLLTPHNLAVSFFCPYGPPGSARVPKLNGADAKCGQGCPLKGIPYDRISQETEILMFQNLQKILFRNDKELSCYNVTEINYGDTFGLELVHDLTFTCDFEHPEFAFDPNEKRAYIFIKKSTDIDRIGLWDMQNNTYKTFSVKDKQTLAQSNKSLCTVLLETKIIQGYYEEDSFYIQRSNIYSKLHVECPVHVSSSSKLGWIVAQFRNGDLVILESRKLEPLFVFFGFTPGYKFHITLKSLQQVRIAIVKDYAGKIVWLSINAVSLRQYYEQGKLKEFKDWKVDKSEVPSSSLSLKEVDVSCSRSVDEGFRSLFRFHRSLGSPSERAAYHPFCNLFIPVTEYQHSILVTSDYEPPVDLTTVWTVTVIAKKGKFKLRKRVQPHSTLIIEGILHGGHFVIRAELTRDSDNNVNIKCESYRGKLNYEEIINQYFGKQLQVNPKMGMKLLKNIWVDTYNPQWKYDLLVHNCNSWCKEKLQVLNIEDKFKSKSYKLFVDLPKDFGLRGFKFTKKTHQKVK